MAFEIPFPTSIPETASISEMFLMENFCGKLSGLLFFNKPVEAYVFRKYCKLHPNFMAVTTDLQYLQNIFQDNIASCLLCLSPLNRRAQANASILLCSLTNRKVNVSPEIIVSRPRKNIMAFVECLDMLLLVNQELSSLQGSEVSAPDGCGSEIYNRMLEDAFVEYLKIFLKSLDEDQSSEGIVESNQVIPKFRACLEASGLQISERTMKYIIKLIRSLKSPTLVAQAFSDLTLNPYLLLRMTSKAKELSQDFLCVYYPQLVCMPLFQKYLAKRILLVEVTLS